MVDAHRRMDYAIGAAGAASGTSHTASHPHPTGSELSAKNFALSIDNAGRYFQYSSGALSAACIEANLTAARHIVTAERRRLVVESLRTTELEKHLQRSLERVSTVNKQVETLGQQGDEIQAVLPCESGQSQRDIHATVKHSQRGITLTQCKFDTCEFV